MGLVVGPNTAWSGAGMRAKWGWNACQVGLECGPSGAGVRAKWGWNAGQVGLEL